jgi:hypothetical protein
VKVPSGVRTALAVSELERQEPIHNFSEQNQFEGGVKKIKKGQDEKIE